MMQMTVGGMIGSGWLTAAAATGTAALAVELGPTGGSPLELERLGVAGLLAVAAWLMLRWFMAALRQKDEALTRLQEQYAAELKDHGRILADELRSVRASNADNTHAVRELTQEIRIHRRATQKEP